MNRDGLRDQESRWPKQGEGDLILWTEVEIGKKKISESAIVLVIIGGSSDKRAEHISALSPSQNAISDDAEEFN